MRKIVTNEDGQVLVLFALLLVVLMGFAALAVDVGSMTLTKTKLQSAADAAALAGAQDLDPENPITAEGKAVEYAKKNGVQESDITAKAGINYDPNDPNKIEVVCKKKVSHTFARVIGFKETEISARAVAKKNSQWDGEALPFLNRDDLPVVGNKIEAWEKLKQGNFESIWGDPEYKPNKNPPCDYRLFNGGKNDDHSKTYFTVDWQDGITVTNGEVANLKQEIGYIYEQNKPVYIFSLSSDAIEKGTYTSVGNKGVIPKSALVLLQVTFDSYDYTGKTLHLTITDVYDINNGEFPTDYLNDDSQGTSSLVE